VTTEIERPAEPTQPTEPTEPTARTAPIRPRFPALAAFRHRNYRLFFGGQIVSLVGTWMQQVAQAWLVLEISRDPFWLGVVAAAQFVPVMILGLFAGVLADVLPKRQTLLAVQVVMMALAIVLAFLTLSGIVEVWMIVVLALLLGCANAVDMPVRQSFAVEMVGRADIGNAVALNSAMFNGARVVGPAIAGLTIGVFGVGLAFVINAASFVAVIAGLLAMRERDLSSPPRKARPESAGEVLMQLREGLSYVRRTPLVLLAVIIVGLVATFGMNFGVVIPALVQEVLDSDASGYGFLMAASGAGSFAGALWLAARRRPRPAFIALGAIVLGAAEVGLAISGLFAVSLVLMLVIGIGTILMAATANTTIQLIVPDGLRGRVMSVYTTIFAGSIPVGGLATGALASGVGIGPTIALGGLLSLATGLLALVWVRRIGRLPDQIALRERGSARVAAIGTARPR
jgi:MFS family permease